MMGNSPPLSSAASLLTVQELGTQDYRRTWDDMRRFNEQRDHETGDEIWLVEHPPVFTLGLNGKAEHILDAHDIPVIQCDRGGQVTYHGPGQVVAYVMMDLQRRKWGVKKLVNRLEEAVIGTLQEFSITGKRRTGAPGVYVGEAKIAALGLRVRRGCSYHGLSLNVDMDLTPFSYINPCGFEGLAATQIKDLQPDVDIIDVKHRLIAHLTRQL
ncbi:MAG: lipoyl(octanoyl) transferase LipB [Gammaproteobacteria bacterium]|jgi:lipoyl(octanoyl) transferase